MGFVWVIIFVAVVVVVIAWLWRTIGKPYMEQAERARQEALRPKAKTVVTPVQRVVYASSADEYEEQPVTVQLLPSLSGPTLDLSEVESTRTRIKGSSYYVSYSDRGKFGGTRYLLVREPDNDNDANAIAIYGKGRKVGHVSASKAASMAPLLDDLGAEAFEVSGTSTSETSVTMWIDLPKLPALRAFVKARA